jgi:hypothetical protein
MDDAERLVGWLSVGILALLLIVLSLTIDQYQHPMPSKDCSKSFIYPICARAYVPESIPPASTIAVYLSILLVIILAILVIYASYHACVIEQKQLITGVGEAAKKVDPPTVQPAKGVDPKSL